jgi:hypothetical protein
MKSWRDMRCNLPRQLVYIDPVQQSPSRLLVISQFSEEHFVGSRSHRRATRSTVQQILYEVKTLHMETCDVLALSKGSAQIGGGRAQSGSRTLGGEPRPKLFLRATMSTQHDSLFLLVENFRRLHILHKPRHRPAVTQDIEATHSNPTPPARMAKTAKIKKKRTILHAHTLNTLLILLCRKRQRTLPRRPPRRLPE